MQKQILKYSVLAVSLLLLLSLGGAATFIFHPLLSLYGSKSKKVKPFIVRVRIARNLARADISLKDRGAVIYADTSGVEKRTEISEGGHTVLFEGQLMMIDGKPYESVKIRIDSYGRDMVSLNGIEYRGGLLLIRTSGGIDVVNTVDLESYLKGVVPCEVNQFWPYEAVKAQAIVSRSFAISQILLRKYKEYDLKSDTFSQVYGGVLAEKWRTSGAVDETRGKVLGYNGKVVPAYFHSVCGGHTEDAFRLWHDDILPLKGVKCDWCRWSPYFHWRSRISTKSILQKLNAAGYKIPHIDEMSVSDPDGSGRYESIDIKCGEKWYEVPQPEFSRMFAGKIKSANFKVKKYPFFYDFEGLGWGHGVGMCQWGAFGLALRFISAEDILKYYYPGASIGEVGDILKK